MRLVNQDIMLGWCYWSDLNGYQIAVRSFDIQLTACIRFIFHKEYSRANSASTDYWRTGHLEGRGLKNAQWEQI